MAREGNEAGLRRVVAAAGVVNTVDGVAFFAWAWAATLLTRDPVWVAALPFAQRTPWAALSLVAGVVVDRMDRRRLILAMDAVRAVAFSIVAVALWASAPLSPAPASGVGDPALFGTLIICALVVGCAEVFRDTAAQTIVPSLTPKAALERANSRLVAVERVGDALLGPALGALLITFAVWAPFTANAVLLLVALVVMRGVVGRFSPPPRAVRDWRREIGAGLAFLRDAPFLRLLAVVTGVWNLCHQMVVIGLVLHAQENLALSALGFGAVLAVGAAGGALGGVCGERVVRAIGPGDAARWSSLASACCFIAMSVAPSALILAIVLFVFEFTSVFWNVVSISYRQRVAPDALLGRVNSVYRLLSWGMMSLGLAASGIVVRAAETQSDRATALTAPFAVAGVVVLVLTVVVWGALARGFNGGPAADRRRSR